jgi:hypothetical protein
VLEHHPVDLLLGARRVVDAALQQVAEQRPSCWPPRMPSATWRAAHRRRRIRREWRERASTGCRARRRRAGLAVLAVAARALGRAAA